MTRLLKIGSLPGRLVMLPLYAGDDEIGEMVLGPKAERWPDVVRSLERDGLPRRSQLFGGLRYIPKVVQFFDVREGLILASQPDQTSDGLENWSPR
jgi:hypothetical protein